MAKLGNGATIPVSDAVGVFGGGAEQQRRAELFATHQLVESLAGVRDQRRDLAHQRLLAARAALLTGTTTTDRFSQYLTTPVLLSILFLSKGKAIYEMSGKKRGR